MSGSCLSRPPIRATPCNGGGGAQSEGREDQNLEYHPNFRGWVEGMIAYIAMVKPEVGVGFRRQPESLRSD